MIKTAKSKKKIEFLFEKGLSFKNKGLFIKAVCLKTLVPVMGFLCLKSFLSLLLKEI